MSLTTHLTALEASGLIRLAQIEPELEYLFRHALVQEAAYGSLVRADRQGLHQTVGDTLERLYPDRREELASVLALHFAAAGELEKAVGYSRLAARRATSMYAYEEAIQHLQAALDLLLSAEPNETRLAVLEELADVYHLIRDGAQAISVYQSALDLWAGLEDAAPLIRTRLHRKITETFFNMLWGGKLKQVEAMSQIRAASRASLEAALKQTATERPRAETVRQLIALANDAWVIYGDSWAPDWDRAERYAQAAVQIAEQLGAPAELSAALDSLASVYYGRGRLREHLEVTLRRLALSRDPRFSDLRLRVHILGSAASALVYVGEYAQAMLHTLEAESLSDHIRAVDRHVHALGLQSQCWFRLDRWDDMFQIAAKRAEMEKLYPRERVGLTCFEIGLTATAHALRGEFDQARALREQAYAIMTTAVGNPDNWPRNAHY